MGAPLEEDFKDPADYWVATLEHHGWKRKHHTLWMAPDGRMFLGPRQAFRVCRSEAIPVPAGEEPKP